MHQEESSFVKLDSAAHWVSLWCHHYLPESCSSLNISNCFDLFLLITVCVIVTGNLTQIIHSTSWLLCSWPFSSASSSSNLQYHSIAPSCLGQKPGSQLWFSPALSTSSLKQPSSSSGLPTKNILNPVSIPSCLVMQVCQFPSSILVPIKLTFHSVI